MQRLPKIVASSVVRSTHPGESHGGVYVLDLESETWEQVLDWNTIDISWEGRGFERGLRGIAFSGETIYLAASNEVYVYDRNFNRLGSFTNRYLHQCHEIAIAGTSLFLSSTGFDSILEYDLEARAFVRGYCFRELDEIGDVFASDPVSRTLVAKPSEQARWAVSSDEKMSVGRIYKGIRWRMRRGVGGLVKGDVLRTSLIGGNGRAEGAPPKANSEAIAKAARHEPPLVLRPFDPNADGGPAAADKLHINNVFVEGERVYFSGTGVGRLYYVERGALGEYATIPHGTHNVRPYRDGVLMHETASDRVGFRTREGKLVESFDVKRYESGLLNADLPKDFCRQGFGRGLAVTGDGLVVSGSSPATISVYEFGRPTPLRSVNITMDVRNAIHGLEVWPF